MNRDEKTLILFKPDCVRKNLSGVILQRLLAEGFRLRAMKMIQLDDAILREHYGHIIDLVIDGEPLFPKLSFFMQTSPEKILLMRAMNAGKLQIFTKLVFPSNMSTLASCLKINVGMAWIGSIMGEYLVSRAGLGYLIVYGGQVFQMDLVMACTIVLCLLAGGMYFLVALLERFMVRWQS